MARKFSVIGFVVVPPAKVVKPLAIPTAMGTLWSLMLLSTREPTDASAPVLAVEVRTKTVLVTTASMIANALVVC